MVELSGGGLELVADPELVRPVDVPVLCGSPRKIEHTTGWRAQIPLEQSLADVLAEWERLGP
jgi:GDP-4-dehydro-6-deoxy-D-mannose reductase